MDINRHIIALATLIAISATAAAQKLSESVTVEGKFTPEVIQADRLPVLPGIITLKAPESILAYDRTGVAANFAPDALSMPATGWRTFMKPDASKGYVSLNLGSWLNSSLSAGFCPINNAETRLNVYLQHCSSSLWHAWNKNEAEGIPEADNRFRYDETLGADLSRKIGDAGSLQAQLQYHLGYFNYYATSVGATENGRIKAPTQTVNDFYASLGWTGNATGPLRYEAKADFRHFAYRAMFTPQSTPIAGDLPFSLLKSKGERESVVDLGGNARYDISRNSTLCLDLTYSGVFNSTGSDVNRLRLLPAYNLTGKNYSLRVGIYMAIIGNGTTKFRIAPDVRFSLRKGISALSAKIGGGTYLRTLAWRHQMDYYANPGDGCHKAAYSPIDISAAYQLNPGGRWTLGLEGKWLTMKDECTGGTYQAFLNGDIFPDEIPSSGRLHGFSLALNAGYEFNRYLRLSGKVAWQPQHGTTGILNGFDRPALTADVAAESRPADKLTLALAYGLRAKRFLLPGNISRLNLKADYRITEKISVGAEINNILNRKEMILPDLPTEGINATAGVQIVF